MTLVQSPLIYTKIAQNVTIKCAKQRPRTFHLELLYKKPRGPWKTEEVLNFYRSAHRSSDEDAHPCRHHESTSTAVPNSIPENSGSPAQSSPRNRPSHTSNGFESAGCKHSASSPWLFTEPPAAYRQFQHSRS